LRGCHAGKIRTVYASRECLFQGGRQNHDAYCIVLGDKVKGSAVVTPEPISYSICSHQGQSPSLDRSVAPITYCSLNAFTGGLNEEQGRHSAVNYKELQEKDLLSSMWSTFSDGKLMARCLNRGAYDGAIGCMVTETGRGGESNIVGHRIAIGFVEN
jgi:hypothetical protein